MKFLGDYKIAFIGCFTIALSIYVARLQFTNNRTGIIVTDEEYPFDDEPNPLYMSISDNDDQSSALEYDYYRESCPSAETIIRKSIRDIYNETPNVAPSIIRLLFHDCFIEGCDASVLLDADEKHTSEKEASPNQSLKGFDVIETIKSELENTCPGVVSCADILVLAAREAVLVAGGPFYPLETGRKDSAFAFTEFVDREIPKPQDNFSVILASFAIKGFNERETVALFGAHSVGITHCKFFEDRLYNYAGTGKPDPELNPVFREKLKTKCPFSGSSASSPSPGSDLPASDYEDLDSYDMSSGTNLNDGGDVVDLSYNNEGGDESFGTRYYRRLMQKKGLMFCDQQLTGSEETEMWVRAYASDQVLFRRDFAMVMMKLSSYHVLTGPLGQVRKTCSKVL